MHMGKMSKDINNKYGILSSRNSTEQEADKPFEIKNGTFRLAFRVSQRKCLSFTRMLS